MNFPVSHVLVMSVALMVGRSAAAQDQMAAVSACIDAGFSRLLSAHSRAYESAQFYIVCQYQDVKKRERNETFTYYPPLGFKILSADLNVVSKTAFASVGNLVHQHHRAAVNLQCKGRPHDELVHDSAAVRIVGRLEYLPTRQDAKNIAGACLEQVLQR